MYELSEPIWKEVEGWPGYFVNESGLVVSRRYLKVGKPNGHWQRINEKQITLKQFPVRGYLAVNLSNKTRRKSVRVHRLVAQAFLPNPQNLPHINHIDGNKTNASVTNLEWCTISHNELHSYRVLGKKPRQSTIDSQLKTKIRHEYFLFKTPYRKLGEKYSLSINTIGRIINHEIWA